jgi:HNH endonuclease
VPAHRPDLGPCWLWTASGSTNGYGHVMVMRRLWRAHRLASILSGTALRDDQELDHLCRNRRCVNPAHLEPVSHRVNTLRGATITAANARKTHCSRGHRFDEANTAIQAGGARKCRACDRERHRERAARLGGWRVRATA